MKNIFLRYLAQLHAQIIRLRNFLFDKGYLPVHNFYIPIVSVGNITVGGTGKTPLVSFLIEYFESKGRSPAIVSRGYRGEFVGVACVENSHSTQFGDEPAWYKERHPHLPIYVGSHRVDVVETVLFEKKVDVILVDDGFQHRYLGRSCDLVVIDATQNEKDYQMLPLGLAREPKASLQRASAICITKANFISEIELGKVIQELKGFKKPIFVFGYNSVSFQDIRSHEDVRLNKQDRVLGVCGIGKPDNFKKVLESQSQLKDFIVFKDHHQFNLSDAIKIYDFCIQQNIPTICLTEKDAVKWPLTGISKNLQVLKVKMEVSLISDESEWDQFWRDKL